VQRDNDSGEDFLYMHRQMIATVDRILARVSDPSYPRIVGWTSPPPPDDPEYPVPELPGMGLEEIKSPAYYLGTMAPQAARYATSAYLASVTLGQLGADLEFTIHNDMHMRWAAPSAVGYRPRTPLTTPVDPQWDRAEYDYLGDTYSSHVNPIFWKLHGWVDDRIEDWRRVHNVDRIVWKGTWEGPLAHPHHGEIRLLADTEGPGIESLEAAAAIVSTAGGFDGFLRPMAGAAHGP
jgi:hypothetical protein